VTTTDNDALALQDGRENINAHNRLDAPQSQNLGITQQPTQTCWLCLHFGWLMRHACRDDNRLAADTGVQETRTATMEAVNLVGSISKGR
jgi:hypothetical protein